MLRVMDAAALLGRARRCAASSAATRSCRWIRTCSSSRRSSSRCSRRRRRAASSTASSSARCPAGPSATTSTTTSATRPGMWIALHRICEKHGVGDQFRIHYDPSHAILMGQDTRSIFQYLKDEGYGFLIAGFHVKGQVIDSKGVAGLGLRRPDRRARRLDRTASRRRTRPITSTPGRSRPCSASTSCPARPSTIRSATCRTARSTGSITSSPRASCSSSTSANTHAGRSSTSTRGRASRTRSGSSRSCKGSIAFTRKIDEAAACMYALQHEVLPAQEIPVQGRGRVAYWT